MHARVFFWIGKVNRITRWRFSRVHVRVYRWLRGGVAAGLLGRPILLLTTIGNRSGRPHTVPLTYLDMGDDFLVVGSYRSDWFANLRAAASAEVEVGGRRFRVDASVVEDASTREAFRRFYPALTRIEDVADGRPVPLIRLHRLESLSSE